jgi:hypothetical protein
MSAAEVDALLERLVAQFESPYDFLRELVQNAMDAGSDRVEVTLESHALGSDEVIFELTILDTGAGMDEAIIDQELTRLFGSGKSGDRTMAGGFGIGFVSVFAWEPEAILVHTGRGGESWELLFHGDRSFEKVAIEGPVEGTTITLFRRGRRSEREAIADAIRDSLWRWCRFCPLELSFEDLDGDDPAELIQDSPEPPELGLGAGLSRVEIRGETTLRVSFAVPANAVFLRRGLILAEGGPAQLLTGVAVELGRSVGHLQIWADSPLLRTSMARDVVLDDAGRVTVERRLFALLAELRGDLLARLEELAAIGEAELGDDDEKDLGGPVDPRWTRERHAIYATLHAHLELEREHLERVLPSRPILRDLAHRKAVSLDAAIERMAGRTLLLAPPPSPPASEESKADELDERAAALAQLIRALRPTSLPVIAGDLGEDRAWLEALIKPARARIAPIERVMCRVEPRAGEALGLCGLLETLLRGLGFEQASIELGAFVDLRGRPEPSPVFGPEVPGAAVPLAFHGPPRLALRRRKTWLNVHNMLVEAAIAKFTAEPLIAGLSLGCAVLGQLERPPAIAEVIKLAEALERERGAK